MASTLQQNHLKLIENIADNEGIKNYQLEISSGKQKGDGYLSNIVLVVIKSSEKSLKLLLKVASDSVKAREQAPVEKAFQREIFMYNEVFKHYATLQIDSDLVFTPTKCYGCLSNKFEECLALENLKENGFQLWNRKLPMDHNLLDLIFRMYGKYHALSFVTQYLYPDKHKIWLETVDNINEYFFTENSDRQFKKLFKIITDFFDDVHTKKKVEDFGNNWREIYLQELKGKYTVLTHGDCWCNNFLFKYNDPTDVTKPIDMRPIDLQLATFNTPVHDLSYCLFSVTDKQHFVNYRDYLTTYHNTMANVLENYNLDINIVYPYKILEEQWEKYVKYGLMSAILVLKAALVSTEDALDIDEEAENDSDFIDSFIDSITGDEEYNRRVRDLVYYFDDNNWI